MTTSYQPFLIANIKTGLQFDVDPWLIPKDAFVTMKNVYLSQGSIHKRKGYSLFQRLVHAVIDEVIGTGDEHILEFTGTLTKYSLRPGDLTITDTVETFTDNGAGVLTGDAGGTGTIAYDTGAYVVTFFAAPGIDQEILATYDYYPELPVMGIWNYVTNSGTEQLVAFNTRRMNYWDDVYLKWEDPTGDDVFTGYDYNFFYLTNWQNVGYITNGIDLVKTWDGSTLADLTVDIDGDLNNDVTYAAFAFPYKDRLVLLRTEEDGNGCFQRARWSAAGNASDWTNDGWIDAPCNDWIISAGFLKDELIVWFERSIWALRYTGSDRLPFRWVRLVSQEGSISPMSMSEFSDEQLGFGSVDIVGFDGRDTYSVSSRLSNYVLEMNQSAIQYSYAGVADEYRQAWFTFPSLGSDFPDKILVLNYDDNSWSIYDLPLHCIGYYNETTSPTWDDKNIDWDDEENIWDLRDFQAGFPRLIGGDRSGNIYELHKTGTDNGADIYAEIKTGRWNPYGEKGLSARLGYVDFLVERDGRINMQVDFYLDSEISPYLTQTINLGGDGSVEQGDRVWVRAYCGATAQYHQMKLSHTASSQTFVIHAIMPWFKAGGRLR